MIEGEGGAHVTVLVFNKRPRLVVAVSAPWSAILRQRSHTMRPHSHGQVFTAPHTRVITGGVLHPPCWPHTPPSTPMAPTGTCLQHAHALTAPRASPAVAPAAPCWHGRRRMRCGRQHSSVRCTAGAPMYDNPALYSNDDAFSERLYWDKRYQQDPTTFEWYRSYDSLRPVLNAHLPRQAHLLQLGVGTSRLQEDMADDGYAHITSVDYSEVAVQRLQAVYAPRAALDYAVADVRRMPQYGDGAFGGVLDKGTLDALLCGDAAEGDAARMLGELWRLLSPGAAYVMITSASPRQRLAFLEAPATPWQQLLVYEVGQQGALSGPFCCSTRRHDAGGSSSSSSLHQQQQQQQGQGQQQQQEQRDAALELPQMGYSHLVYVCCKPALRSTHAPAAAPCAAA